MKRTGYITVHCWRDIVAPYRNNKINWERSHRGYHNINDSSGSKSLQKRQVTSNV